MTYTETMRSLSVIPNWLSRSRIGISAVLLMLMGWEFAARKTLLVPFALNDYFDVMWLCFVLALIGAATDQLDGFFAKLFKEHGWETEEGRWLDPIADKIYGFVLMIGIPMHLGASFEFLFYYAALSIYISWYSWKTSGMRFRGEISAASFPAQVKTYILMTSQLLFMAYIARDGLGEIVGYKIADYQNEIFGAATALMFMGTICCIIAMRDYNKQVAAKQQSQNAARPT